MSLTDVKLNRDKVDVKGKENKFSIAFKYFREGKTPLNLVMDGIMSPDEAQEAYNKFLSLVRFTTRYAKSPPEGETAVREVKLSSEEWHVAFKAFKEGKTPVDVVIEKGFDPEKAEYAYIKFIELSDKYMELTDVEWSLAFYFFDKGYKPIDLATRGILTPRKARYAYRKYLEMTGREIFEERIAEERVVPAKEAVTRIRTPLEIDIPDSLIVLFVVDSILADVEYLTAAVAFTRTGAFGAINPILNGLNFLFGPRVAIPFGLILTVLLFGLIMFLSPVYLKDRRLQKLPLFLCAIAELVFIISHVIILATA